MRRRLIGIISALMISAHLLAQGYIETINIENQAVSDYMLDAAQTYSSNPDYRVSVVTKYNNSDKYGKKLYWPRGKEVVWIPTTVADNIQEIRITVSENEDYNIKNDKRFNNLKKINIINRNAFSLI